MMLLNLILPFLGNAKSECIIFCVLRENAFLINLGIDLKIPKSSTACVNIR